MDKTLRNTFVGIVATIAIAVVSAWVQLNTRISVLEVQVDNDHAMFIKSEKRMEELLDKVDIIKDEVTKLSTKIEENERSNKNDNR